MHTTQDVLKSFTKYFEIVWIVVDLVCYAERVLRAEGRAVCDGIKVEIVDKRFQSKWMYICVAHGFYDFTIAVDIEWVWFGFVCLGVWCW